MFDYIKLESKKCKNCYKCIRHCPVKSIKLVEDKASIIDAECILCGECFVVCPQEAKVLKNDLKKVKKLIEDNEKVVASIAPAFYANFKGVNIKSVEIALKKLGFYGVEETAVGATIVKKEYERIIEEKENSDGIVISSSCYSINLLIQKYYPESIKYLADVISPMVAHCMDIKRRIEGAKTVFIGPCVAKKAEADKYSEYVDATLTFEDLTEWLQEKAIEFEEATDDIKESRARLFPTEGGIIRTMDKTKQKGFNYIAVDGIEKAKEALTDIASGRIHNCFIEMSACIGSCICGPAMHNKERAPITSAIEIRKYAGDKDFVTERPDTESIKANFNYLGTNKQRPGGKMLEEILRKMGKTLPEHELNCGACGYDTCREKAYAIYQGKANPNMCLPFLIEKADLFSENIIKNMQDGIVVLDESFNVKQMNDKALKLFNIKNVNDIIGNHVLRILDPTPFVQVTMSKKSIRNEMVYLPEYQKYVEQTIIYDKGYHILMGFYRDITEVEKSHEKKERIKNHTIETTNKVIEKQMRIAQEIASLLGETTAETKIALTKLKEALNDE